MEQEIFYAGVLQYCFTPYLELVFVLFFIICFASSSVLFCIISNSYFNYYICWNLKFCRAESWCWWWCLYITTISALIHCVIFSVGVVHWIFYVKIQTCSLSAVEMHSKMKRGLTSNIGFLNCVTFNQLMQNTSVETWAIWLLPASWAPAINLLFAVIFPCVYDLLLQYFYGLSFLAMWAQIEDLLATKRTMSLLFWLWVMDPVPSGKAWLRHGSVSSAHSAVILVWGWSSLNSRR